MTTALATSWFVTNADGTTSTDLDTLDLGLVLAQLDRPVEPRQPSVSLSHQSGWSLRAFSSGRLILSHPDEAERHLRGATRELVAGLWSCLAEGDLDAVEAQPWRAFHAAA